MYCLSDTGRMCILDIEVSGVKAVREIPELEAKYVFICPPSMDVLETRLRGRGTETKGGGQTWII